MQKTIAIKTLGCKMNQYESAQIAGRFSAMGWLVLPFGETADIVLVNTCTVTDRSDKKCRNYIRQGAKLSRMGKTVVTGCMVDGQSGVERMNEVIAAFGNGEKGVIPERAAALIDGEVPDAIVSPGNDSAPKPLFRTRGYLKVQDGCDGACSYCIVPSVRGKPASRGFDEILEGAKELIHGGCPEIVLTGITIGKYESGGRDLADLAAGMAGLSGEFRIRITSIEPNHVTEKLIGLFAREKVCRHIHLPLQSGSAKILAMMNRKYTPEEYCAVIKKIRNVSPGTAIGTDIIIGFPGETEEDFSRSLAMVERAGFAYVHQFTFSKRSGTAASKMRQDTAHAEIEDRVLRMRSAAAESGFRYRKQFEGSVLPCVVEPYRKNRAVKALSDTYIRIDIENSRQAASAAGKIKPVMLASVEPNRTTGVILE